MARQTFTQLQNTTKDYVSASSGSLASSTIANFIKEHINKTYHFIQRELKGYIVEDLPQTALTVADQQYYHYPPNIYPPIKSATWTVSSVAYPLEVVSSQKRWDEINEIDFSGTTVPQFIFPRRDDFGLYPTPSTASETLTLVCSMLDRDMSIEDYTTGTVTVTNGDATVTHSASGFTAAMVGRWFQTDDDQYWYRINSRTDADNVELESVFEGTTASGASFTIGESPELPPELHELIPHGAAQHFFIARKDITTAQAHLNYLKYGSYLPDSNDIRMPSHGLLGAKLRYSQRDESALVYHRKEIHNRFDERWTSTLSSTI